MAGGILAKTLRDRRRGLLGWSAGIVGLVAVIAAYWPSVRDSPDLRRFVEELPEGVRAFVGEADITTPVGFLAAELFSFMVPLLFLIVAIGMGARAVAAEEERGTIDLLMALPITRRRMVVEKVAAGVVVLAALGLVLLASLLGAAATGMDLPAGRMAQISLATVLLALPFGALALAISCASGARGLAVGLASAAAVAAYMVDALAPLVDGLAGWRDLSPFAWYARDEVLDGGGLAAWRAALLVGVAAALTAVAVVALERRDLRA